LLEQLGSQMTLVLEAVTSSKTELEASIRALDARLSQRITVLEEAVRQLAADLRATREDLAEVRQEVAELREEVAGLRRDFDQREERGRLSALEVRVAAIEARLGIGSR
jgi:predicted  nucleic acid-binding Zn-ribbon protein